MKQLGTCAAGWRYDKHLDSVLSGEISECGEGACAIWKSASVILVCK